MGVSCRDSYVNPIKGVEKNRKDYTLDLHQLENPIKGVEKREASPWPRRGTSSGIPLRELKTYNDHPAVRELYANPIKGVENFFAT